MWFALSALLVLFGLLVIGRLLVRAPLIDESLTRLPPVEPPALPPPPVLRLIPRAEPVAVRPAPGAPNIDPPTDRHVSHRGTATITRRTGRRTSTGGT